MLVETIIRHGSEIILKDVENEATGEKVSLTVAQYISYDLGLDGLSFNNQLYNTILDEAVAHSNEEGFHAVDYFTHHPDITISQLAVNMSVETVKLSKRLELKERENSLRDRVIHLVLDFRMEYVKERLRILQSQLQQISGDMEQLQQTMSEIKRLQDIRNLLARRLGNDIIS